LRARAIAVLAFSALALPLAACGKSETENAQFEGETSAPTTLPNESATANESASVGPGSFTVCATCHSTKPGENLIGPSLFGVVGRKAATEPGFSYSPAMKAANITWDKDSIDRFTENPYALVPGTKMPFAGTKEKAKRDEIIAFLETLK
jgi:cytochrome c